MADRATVAIHEGAHACVAHAVGLDVVHARIDEKPSVRTRYPAHPAALVRAVFQARLESPISPAQSPNLSSPAKTTVPPGKVTLSVRFSARSKFCVCTV